MVRLKEFMERVISEDDLFKGEGSAWGYARLRIIPDIIEGYFQQVWLGVNPEVCPDQQDLCREMVLQFRKYIMDNIDEFRELFVFKDETHVVDFVDFCEMMFMVLDIEVRSEIYRIERGMSEDIMEVLREDMRKGNGRRMSKILSEFLENEEES